MQSEHTSKVFDSRRLHSRRAPIGAPSRGARVLGTRCWFGRRGSRRRSSLTSAEGIGRLIRDDEDRGLLAIMDPRLYTKPYGKRFLAALPVMPIVRNLDGMKDFFSKNR